MGGNLRGKTVSTDWSEQTWRDKKKTRMRPLGAHGLHSLNVGIVLAAPTYFLVIWGTYHPHWGRDGVVCPLLLPGRGRVHPFLPQGSFFLLPGLLFFCPRPLFFCLWAASIYEKNCLFYLPPPLFLPFFFFSHRGFSAGFRWLKTQNLDSESAYIEVTVSQLISWKPLCLLWRSSVLPW